MNSVPGSIRTASTMLAWSICDSRQTPEGTSLKLWQGSGRSFLQRLPDQSPLFVISSVFSRARSGQGREAAKRTVEGGPPRDAGIQGKSGYCPVRTSFSRFGCRSSTMRSFTSANGGLVLPFS